MGKDPLVTSDSVVWVGKPWILPGLIGRTIGVIVVAVVVFWFEIVFGVVSRQFLAMSLWLWTALIFLVVWFVSIAHLVVLKASTTYILRNDGLEVRSGVTTSRSFVVSPSGFADLEVNRSVSARVVNSGDITVRTQGQSEVVMQRIRDTWNVANKVREVMSRPVVRLEGQAPP
jgi:uncharacterized membrane protein YdbT with pleckstrin-like domain